MAGSVFLSGGWSIGSGLSSVVSSGAGGRRTGAMSRRSGNSSKALSDGGVLTTLLTLVGIRTRFQQVDYRHFRELINVSTSGPVHTWGRNTYLYDSRNRLVAVKRAARFEANGRSTPTSYFVRRCV